MSTSVIAVFLSSLLVATAIHLLRAKLIGRRDDLKARQASHAVPTPRLGGVAILVGLAVALALALPGTSPVLLATLLCAALPLIIAGLLEDIGHPMSPRARLLAAGLSAALMILLTGFVVPRTGSEMLDPWFRLLPVTAVFTIFATTGVSHAFNLIDGLNGLAGFTALICSAALAVICAFAGLTDLREVLALLQAAVLGFLILNFPRGLVFLGDAGAYCLGFLLAWIAVAMLVLAPAISPWALVLVFFWPIADTILAMARRAAGRKATAHPDRMHVHQVVMRGIEIKLIGPKLRHRANPLASLILIPFMAMPSLAGVVFWNDDTAAFTATLAFALLFTLSYRSAVLLVRSRAMLGLRRAAPPRRTVKEGA